MERDATITPHSFSSVPDGRSRVVVVDANALIEDALARTGRPWTALSSLIRRELVTVLAAPSVETEVYEHLPRVAAATGHVPEEALNAWESDYRPFIRFVELGRDPLTDPAAAAVVDADDVAAMALARFVGPALLITRDKHLTRVAGGHGDWLAALHQLGPLVEIDDGFVSAAQAAWLLVAGPTLALGAAGRGALRQPLVAGGLLAAAGYLLHQTRPDVRAIARRLRASAGSTLTTLALTAAHKLEERDQYARVLEGLVVHPPKDRTTNARAARALAELGRPVPLPVLHSLLAPDMSLGALRERLRTDPAFRARPGVGYELGILGQAGP